MNQLDTNIKTHFITFRDYTNLDAQGKPQVRTVYMSQLDYDPIQRALDAGRSEVFIRTLSRSIPKRNYEASGEIDSNMRSPQKGQSMNNCLVVCACSEKIPYPDFNRHSSSVECRQKYYANIRVENNHVRSYAEARQVITERKI